MINNDLKIFSLILFSLMCISCGENLWVGGASVQGTGDPKPNNPGPADDNHNIINNIFLSAPVEDECHGLKRRLRFLDTLTHEPITEESTLNLNHQISPNGTILLELTVTNTGNDTITERQPSCHVPVALYLNDSQNRAYPESDCPAEHDVTYAPQQTRTFEIPYMTVGEMTGIWKYGEKSIYFKNNQPLLACNTLDISFKLFNTKDVISY